MGLWQRLAVRLTTRRSRASREADLDRELRSHLDLEAEELQEAGAPPADAQNAARRAFGRPAAIKEDVRAAWGWTSLERLSQDVGYALRLMRKNPGFTAVAVTTLGLGIGAAAAIFGLIQGVLLSPPPYADLPRLVLVTPARLDGQPYDQGCTIGEWMEWRLGSRSLEPPALYRWSFNFLVHADGSESLEGMAVTRDYFRVLGLQPLLGRTFSERETAVPNEPPTAIILGYELWERRFDRDPDIIGKTVRISRQPAPLPVVGVMPPDVRFLPDPVRASEPNYDLDARVDFWIPAVPDETRPESRGWNAVSRLRDGATAAEAQAEVAVIAQRIARTEPALEGLTARIVPLQDALNHEGRRLLLPLLGAVTLLFFIACGNVAGLLLAGGLQRQQEYALRSAFGASHWRLFRQVMTESVALALGAAVLGAGLAAGTVALLKAIGGDAVPRADAVAVGWPVFAFGLVAALVAAALAAVLPAARASYLDPIRGLRSARSSAGRPERRLLGALATLQIALTVALLAGAALLVRSVSNLAGVRPGYDTEHVLAMTVTSVQPDMWESFHRQTIERVSAVAGVTHAAFVWGLPLTSNKWSGDMEIVGQSESSTPRDRIGVPIRSVTPDYFEAMDITLVHGRTFQPSDDRESAPVALVNEALAERYFSTTNPVGRHMRPAGEPDRTIEIVGVVSDTRTDDLRQEAGPEVYLPFWQSGAFSKHLIVRAGSDPRPLAARIRQEIREVDPTAAVEHVKTMADIRRASVAPHTFAMRLLIGFSAAATLLALVGIYGVLSLSVGSRTRELAVRVAIGAKRHEILRQVLGEGLRLIASGLVVGIVVALLLGRVLEAWLFEATPADPLTLAGTAVLFAVVALSACLLPALRAARVEPVAALRDT